MKTLDLSNIFFFCASINCNKTLKYFFCLLKIGLFFPPTIRAIYIKSSDVKLAQCTFCRKNSIWIRHWKFENLLKLKLFLTNKSTYCWLAFTPTLWNKIWENFKSCVCFNFFDFKILCISNHSTTRLDHFRARKSCP